MLYTTQNDLLMKQDRQEFRGCAGRRVIVIGIIAFDICLLRYVLQAGGLDNAEERPVHHDPFDSSLPDVNELHV